MLFLTFHGPERFRDSRHDPHDDHDDAHATEGHGGDPKESPWVVTVPLIALAIPSVLIGAVTVAPVLFGSYFGQSILVLHANDVVAKIGEDFAGPVSFALHGLLKPPFWFAAAGVATAWLFFLKKPQLADQAARRYRWLYRILTEKYYFDWFNEKILAALTRGIGVGLWKGGDEGLIDGAMVNGTAAGVGWFGGIVRRVQSGYLYSYAFWMVIGLVVLLGWFLSHP
jgi:NADH-quinone oxidoreductase subunit L